MKDRKDLQELINFLKSRKKKVWKRVAELLDLPRKRQVEVNLYKLSKYASDNKVLLVPGKILGSGKINKKVRVSAFAFSKSALDSLKSSNSDIIPIKKLVEQDPDGRNIMILI